MELNVWMGVFEASDRQARCSFGKLTFRGDTDDALAARRRFSEPRNRWRIRPRANEGAI